MTDYGILAYGLNWDLDWGLGGEKYLFFVYLFLLLFIYMIFLLLQPRVTLKFPHGEVSLGEKEEEEARRTLSVSGIVKSQLTNGIFTAQFNDEDLKLRYCYKVMFSPGLIFHYD